MLHYLQIWLKKERIDSFKNISKETGRTQVEIFERMTEAYKETDEYAMLVKLNSKQKKRNTLIALVLIVVATLSLFLIKTSTSQDSLQLADLPRWAPFLIEQP